MLLKRAADIAEALYSVPRPHSQLQALPSSPAHGSVMGLGSYPSQLGVSIGDPGQSSQGEQTVLSFCLYQQINLRTEPTLQCFLQVISVTPAVCPQEVTPQPPLLSSRAMGAAGE